MKEKEKKVKELIGTEKEFKGYTIEEIRFQRALVAMEAEFCKTKMSKSLQINKIKKEPFGTFRDLHFLCIYLCYIGII